MSLFKVKIISQEGETREENIEATEQLDIYRQVKEKGGSVISVEEQKEGRLAFVKKMLEKMSGVKTTEKIMFAKNMSNMIKAGLTVSRALDVIKRQTKNKKFARIVVNIQEEISKGLSFSEALKKYPNIFSNLFISMSHAGEESGNLAGSLGVVAMQMDKNYQLQKKIKGAMMYPGIIFSLMIVIAILMLIYIVPTLTKTFQDLGVELPLTTRMIIWVSDFVSGNLIWLGLGVAAAAFIVPAVIKSNRGHRTIDFVLLHTPLINTMVREINSARTARTLSSLLSSGVEVVTAIGITGDVVQNTYYKEVLKEAQETIQKGEVISAVFERYNKLYPVFVAEMASVGEETGQLPTMFLNTAEFYENEVELKTKNMSTIIEPFMMIFIGLGVGFFVLAMMGPMYSLADKI
jgi:type IV pilus assembly protein PilC